MKFSGYVDVSEEELEDLEYRESLFCREIVMEDSIGFSYLSTSPEFLNRNSVSLGSDNIFETMRIS